MGPERPAAAQISIRAHPHSSQRLCSSGNRSGDSSLDGSLGLRVAGIKTGQLLLKGSPNHKRVLTLNEAAAEFDGLFLSHRPSTEQSSSSDP